MIKRIVIILFIIIVAVLVIFKLTANKQDEIKYREISTKIGNISKIVETNGTVKPRNRLEIIPPVSGRVDQILVSEGMRVKKGEILAWMSSTERAALLDTARAKGEAELKKWESVYKPTPIIAPLTGFIIKRNTEPGQTVNTSDSILVMADDLIVKAQVDETDMGKLKKRQAASIELDAYPEQMISGEIEHIAYESEVINNVTIYQVDIKPLDNIKMLRSGMSADIKIVVDQKSNVLLLPAYAIVDSRRGNFVLVQSSQSGPERRKITTGIDDGEMVEIVSGIEEGDLILAGASASKDGRFRRFNSIPGMGKK